MIGILGVIFIWVAVGLNIMDLSIFMEWEIFRGYIFSFIFLLLVDWIRVRFRGLVLLISGIVVIYSGEYMGGDKNIFRFLLILILFVLSIVFMVFRPNLIRILLGWDGLGLVSYCLVIYYQNIKSLNSGLLTILSNRIGDIALLVRISWLFNYGSWNFLFLEYIYAEELSLILILVILASLTKRAQIPFSAWLPAAIAAPTPISALVHSSTLVTAGVYLIIRFNEMLGMRRVLYYISVGTIFMSGLGANFETDLKKIIALSTLRQLGVIIIALSLGLVELAYFHLLMHALFKSLLFLCAGVYIHGYGDKQDIRTLGGVMESSPLTSFYFIGCSLALCGFPFISGFYSKDLILEIWIIGDLNLLILVLVLLSTAFTISYSFRLFSITTIKFGYLKVGLRSIETFLSLLPIRFLFILAVVRGSLIGWFFIPGIIINLFLVIKLLILGFFLLYLFYQGVLGSKIFNFFDSTKNVFELLSGVFFSSFWLLIWISVNWSWPMKLGGQLIKLNDQGWFESLGPQGVHLKIRRYSFLGDFMRFMGFKKLILGYLIILMFVLWGINNYLNSLKRALFWRSRSRVILLNIIQIFKY